MLDLSRVHLEHAQIQLLEGIDGTKRPCKDCGPESLEGIAEEGARLFWAGVGLVVGMGAGYFYARSQGGGGKKRKSLAGHDEPKKKKSLGDYSADEYIDAAHVASEDGDCSRVEKQLKLAEKAGANVDRLRTQLAKSCASDALNDLGANMLSYGHLPGWSTFKAAFDADGGGSFPMTLKGADARAADGTVLGDGDHTAKELYKGLQQLVDKFEDGNEDAGSLASGILTTLGFEWV